MTTFWLIAGVLVLLALAFFVPALRRGARGELGSQQARNIEIARERLGELEAERDRGELDDASYEQARRELQLTLASELVDERSDVSRSGGGTVLVALLVLIPLMSVGAYQYLGSPEHLAVVGPGVSAETASPHGTGGASDLASMVQALADRLEREPDNPDGWYMLGRSYMSMGRYDDAVTALEKLRSLIGDHPAALVMLADAIAMGQGGRISGRPAELVMKALELKPEYPSALWVAGMAAVEQG
ncbi:MAG: c-type cytochrome biogenesis protein CcmI, partial [Gammaproteobacteria bacterium]